MKKLHIKEISQRFPFLKNIGLKILSVFVGFLIWLVVVNVDDPEKTEAFVISEQRITQMNVDEVQNQADKEGKIYRVNDDNKRVTVYVTARRSVLDKIKLSDIKVVADMKNMTFHDTVPYQVTVGGVSQENIQCVPSVMNFKLEDKTEATYAISLSTSGKPEEGYELGGVELMEGNSVIIAGPVSTTKIIDKVAVQVAINDLSENQTVEANIVITDKNGNTMSKTQLDSLEIKTTEGVLIKERKVNAAVTLWKVKSNVRLEVNTENIGLAKGCSIKEVTVNPPLISLAGTDSILEALGGKLVINGIKKYAAKETFEENIDLSEYLLENYNKTLKLESSAATAVSVKVVIEKDGITTVEVPVSSLDILAQPVGMRMILTPADKLNIEVKTEEDITIAPEDVQIIMDMNQYQEVGTYTVPLEVKLPKGCTLEKTPSITVSLEKMEPVTEAATETETEKK